MLLAAALSVCLQFNEKKFFPLPEYEFSVNKVKLTIIGKVVDINYAKRLRLCRFEFGRHYGVG